MSGRRHERGFALLIVLLTLGLLALLVSTLAGNASQDAKLATTLRAEAVDGAAADAVISEVIMDVLRSGIASAQPRRFGPVRVTIGLQEFSGRMNPNIAPATMLEALMLRIDLTPGVARSLAAAVVGWRTPGSNPSQQRAKAVEYRAAGLSYGPPGRPFENLDQLGYVLGMTPAILLALKPHLTIWTTGPPDPAYADALVLAALRDAGAASASRSAEVARVIAITAVASQPDAPREIRRAVVRFGFSPDGRGWRILAWDDGEPAR